MTESTEKKTVAERAAGLSDEVLESVGARQQSAIEAVRKFVDTLDEAMPNLVDRRCARRSSTPPWIWPSRSPRRRTSSCAASGVARAGR